MEETKQRLSDVLPGEIDWGQEIDRAPSRNAAMGVQLHLPFGFLLKRVDEVLYL